MFKKIKLTKCTELLEPHNKLTKGEYYLEAPILDDPTRTLRAYQTSEGKVFLMSAILPEGKKFVITAMLRNPEPYKLYFLSVNGDIEAINKFILSGTAYKYPKIVNIPLYEAKLSTCIFNLNVGYSMLIGKRTVSLKRFPVRTYGYVA